MNRCFPVLDVWNVDLGSYVTQATIPGSNDWTIDGVGPTGKEVLFGSNPDKNNDSRDLYLYSIPQHSRIVGSKRVP